MKESTEKLEKTVEVINQKMETLMEMLLPSNKEFLSVKESAKYLQCSESMIYKMIQKDVIEYHKPNNGKVFISRESILSWIKNNGRV
jgi:excisionase family DNA binding protein